jgi:hypothetical protein
MKRIISIWGVTAGGLLLAGWGLVAMWSGWDQIQIERGWSLYIGGAAALAGGVVTMAIGVLIARLDRLLYARVAAPILRPQFDASAFAPSAGRETPAAPARKEPQPAFADALLTKNEPSSATEEAVEVDRYATGDTVYVMFSDGAVEVRTPAGLHRYASLALLRADAETRQP